LFALVVVTAFIVADQKTDVTHLGTLSMLATFVTEDSENDRALRCFIT
jgi:hypothetical protein